jgi:hypothetical protein
MAVKIRPVEYFYCNVKDQPGEAYRLLSGLAAGGVNLLAFNAIPIGPDLVQLILFPTTVEALARAAQKAGMVLTGPQRAFLIQGDDELGALSGIHRKLADANINVYASSGVTDGKGGYGYIVYVRPQDVDAAATTLGV